MKHKTIREGDELTCACGLRWGVGEDDPHRVDLSDYTKALNHANNFVESQCGGETATQVTQQVKECNERIAKIIKSLGE